MTYSGPIIDIHAHLATQKVDGRGSIEQLKEELTKAGVEKTLLIAGRPRDSVISSESLLRAVGNDSRFCIVSAIDIEKDGEKQAKEFEQSRKQGDIVGIKLYPGYQYFNPSDSRLEPIYAMAARNNLPVIIHSGDCFNPGNEKPPLLKYSKPLSIDEAAKLHPNVTFVIAHLGNPWFDDAMAVLYANNNVYADLSGLFVGEQPAPRYAGFLERKIADVLAYVDNPQKFLFGTDWPLAPEQSTIDFLTRVIPEEDQNAFFSGNAKRLFGL